MKYLTDQLYHGTHRYWVEINHCGCPYICSKFFCSSSSKSNLSLVMEIVSVQGSKSKILIKPGQARELGRANGFNSSDRTISRRQVSFFNPSRSQNQAHCLQFEVIGVNPIYVCRHGEVKVFRRFERGEMESGDLFCLCAKNPVWYTLRNVENGGERVVENVPDSELAGSLESVFEFNRVEDLPTEDVDFLGVDHVKGLLFSCVFFAIRALFMHCLYFKIVFRCYELRILYIGMTF